MNQNAMNHHTASHSTLFQDRNLNAPAFQPRPTRFSVEDESEGVELFLRALLIMSLVVALAICNGYLTAGHSQPNILPSHNTAIAAAQPAAAPATEAL